MAFLCSDLLCSEYTIKNSSSLVVGQLTEIELQSNLYLEICILIKAEAPDRGMMWCCVCCVWFQFPIRHILFRMALTTIETHLLHTHSSVPPPPPPPPRYFKFAQGKEVK